MQALEQLRELVKTEFEEVNQLIKDSLYSKISLVNDISGYIVNSGGKRLRPLLVLLLAKACNYDNTDKAKLAVIIEFIHTATLLHDDVVDESLKRRGLSTANNIWGNKAAVLVGDFLYSRSFELMVEIGNMQILDVIANATNVIAEGEVLQLMHKNNPNIQESDYLDVINFKTAKLFEAATHTAAVLTDSSEQIQTACLEYGKNLGIAYQLVDDILDYNADNAELGKNLGDDLAEGKTTLPLIYLLKHGSRLEKHMVEQAIKNNGKEDNLVKITDAINNSGAIEYSIKTAEHYANLAKSSISPLADSKYKDMALKLVDFVVNRKY